MSKTTDWENGMEFSEKVVKDGVQGYMAKLPDEEKLLFIPLKNGITFSEKATQNGMDGYLVSQGKEQPKFMPAFKAENGMTYGLNPCLGVYFPTAYYTTDSAEQ